MKELSNKDYHANRTHLSSSMLKLLLKNPLQFYNEWVLGQKLDEYKAVFVEGSLTHTMCLEPHKIDEYAVFSGLRRSGKAYEDFLAANPGKTVVTAAQILRAEKYTQACMALPAAVAMLTGGAAEHTMHADIMGTAVKARADYINWTKHYIVDVKTTSQPSDLDLFRHTCSEFGYDLSAALYCAIATATYGHPFDFYWVVISKTDLTCEIYKMSAETMAKGTSAYLSAISLYKRCITTGNWELNKPKLTLNTNSDYEIVEV